MCGSLNVRVISLGAIVNVPSKSRNNSGQTTVYLLYGLTLHSRATPQKRGAPQFER